MNTEVVSKEIINFEHRNLRFASVKEAIANICINGRDIRASFTASKGGGGGSGIAIDSNPRLSFAYVMNNCLGTVLDGDDRAASLCRALYAVL